MSDIKVTRTPLPAINSHANMDPSSVRDYAADLIDNAFNGPDSFYPDGMQKNPYDRLRDLKSVISKLTELKQKISNISGIQAIDQAIKDMNSLRFETDLRLDQKILDKFKNMPTKFGDEVHVFEASDPKCFGPEVNILMADGSIKNINNIQVGDTIMSFEEGAERNRNALVAKRVLRTFINEDQIVIDFHGTKVTPGHAYLCGDGEHRARFRQIMNIIRDDGTVVLADGSLMRAATGCLVGSAGDAFVEVQIAYPGRHQETGEAVTLLKERGRIRVGTRVQRPDGSSFSFLDLLESNGWTLQENGLVSQRLDQAGEPLLYMGQTIPKPEDYILSLSQLTLADLYDDPRQVEMPAAIGGMRQGESNAVVLQAADALDTNKETDRSPLSLRRAARTIFGGRRNRAPKHAGETVH